MGFPRAFDVEIVIRVDGAVQTPISLNSGTWNRGLTTEEVAEVGKAVPSVDGINGLKVLTLDANAGRWIHDLFDAQELKNAGEGNVIIDASFKIKVDGGLPVGYIMPDCVAHEPGSTIGGGTERVTESITLTSETAERTQ